MKTFDERYAAWIDDRLTGEEAAAFERELDAANVPAEGADAPRLGAFIRTHAAAPALTNVDFFNHQIRARIEVEIPPPRHARRERTPVWWLAWAGAASLLVAFALYKTMVPAEPAPGLPGQPYFAEVVDFWTAEPGVSASTVYTPQDNVTVLWLDGLDYLPANYVIQ